MGDLTHQHLLIRIMEKMWRLLDGWRRFHTDKGDEDVCHDLHRILGAPSPSPSRPHGLGQRRKAQEPSEVHNHIFCYIAERLPFLRLGFGITLEPLDIDSGLKSLVTGKTCGKHHVSVMRYIRTINPFFCFDGPKNPIFFPSWLWIIFANCKVVSGATEMICLLFHILSAKEQTNHFSAE